MHRGRRRDRPMIDKATLLKARLAEQEVDIPGVGTVRVRALSRAEALEVQGLGGDVAAIERKILALGMVDPPLTDAEVGEWYAAAPAGELEPVCQAIVAMSGLSEGAPKR